MLQNLALLMSHIDLRSRISIIILVGMSFLSAFAELISIGAIIPFLTVLSDPKILTESLFLSRIKFLADLGNRDLILFTGLAFCAATIVTTILRMTLFFLQVRVSRQIGRCFSNKIFRNILNQPLKFHMETNSSKLNSVVIKEVDRVIVKYINPSIVFASSGLILVVIISTLVYISFEISLIVSLGIGVVYFLIGVFSKPALASSSGTITSEQSKVIRILNESLGLIRDILIRGNEVRSQYLRRFEYSDWEVRKAGSFVELLGIAPRFLIEAVGMILIVGVAIYNVVELDRDLGSILPIIGAFALGAQRMLPLVQSMYAHMVSMRGHKDDVVSVLYHLSLQPEFLEDQSSRRRTFNHDIQEIKLVNVKFGYLSQQPILSNVNVSMRTGRCVGIKGKSGAGKSTFADLVMALTEPEYGQLLVDQLPVWKDNVKEWRSKISHVPQNDFFLDATVRENLIGFDPDLKCDESKLNFACEVSGVWEMLSNRPLGLDTLMGENANFFSGGQRQRIGLARALYQQKPVLVLDEAMSALDYESERKIINKLKNLPYSALVIIVSHRQELLQECDSIVEISSGTAHEFQSNI